MWKYHNPFFPDSQYSILSDIFRKDLPLTHIILGGVKFNPKNRVKKKILKISGLNKLVRRLS
jgi:hypothetical protein